MQVSISGAKYQQRPAWLQFYQDVESRVARLPGVKAEGVVTVLPLTGSVGWGSVNIEGYNPPPGQELQVDIRNASGNYFKAMEIRLVKGRYFNQYDTPEVQQAVIIDEQFAQRFWPGGDAIGKHLWFDPKKPFTIVGVVGNVKQYGLDADSKIAMYMAQSQNPASSVFLVARTASNASALANSIVREIHAVDADVPVYEIQTMSERLYQSMARQRFSSTMLGAFALFALLLAAVGIYGVMSYLVTQSTHDIGVRVALGAGPGNIIGLVVREGMQLVGIGIVAGLLGAMALTRVMSTLLFGVSARDGLTFGAVALLLALVALAATVIPARRATRVDPMVALREE
jgi:putative ABC transport system permease protein